jgi:hypothetical protein
MGWLEDRIAIERLLYMYAHLIDSGRNDLIATEIFAEDAEVDMGGGFIAGRAALHEFYSSSPIFTKYPTDLEGLRHDITNVIIDVDGDRANSQARVTAWHWHRGVPGGPTRPADLVITGGYQDEHARTAQGWRIRRRRGCTFGTGIGAGAPPASMGPLFAQLANRIPTWPEIPPRRGQRAE